MVISFIVGVIIARLLKVIIFRLASYQFVAWPPLWEPAFGLALMLLYSKYGASIDLLYSWIILCFLFIMSFLDFLYGIIPDWLNYMGLLIGLGLGILEARFITCLVGAIVGFSVMYIIYLFSRGGMGGGDVKAAAMIGAFLGSKYVLMALMLAFVLGAIIGISLIITGRKGIKSAIAFGPFMALGSFITMLYGNRIISYFWIK